MSKNIKYEEILLKKTFDRCINTICVCVWLMKDKKKSLQLEHSAIFYYNMPDIEYALSYILRKSLLLSEKKTERLGFIVVSKIFGSISKKIQSFFS